MATKLSQHLEVTIPCYGETFIYLLAQLVLIIFRVIDIDWSYRYKSLLLVWVTT